MIVMIREVRFSPASFNTPFKLEVLREHLITTLVNKN